MGTDQNAFLGPDENDLVLHPEGPRPLRWKPNPIPWFDRGGPGRIHDPLDGATGGKKEGVVHNPSLRVACSIHLRSDDIRRAAAPAVQRFILVAGIGFLFFPTSRRH